MAWRLHSTFVLSVAIGATALAGLAACSSAPARATWNAKDAAAYLDRREEWWMHWRGAARDHGTFCISCHTALPYALARPRLDRVLGEAQPAAPEQALDRDVLKRVRLWSETRPYYTDRRSGPGKSAQSRGTEAILNALILAARDARTGQLSATTRTAFDHMWALQQTRGPSAGTWPWQEFGLEPWETRDAKYYGAAMAALAVGLAPDDYRATPAIQPALHRLIEYLHSHFAAQPLHQKLALLWASSALPGLVSAARRESIIQAAFRAQHYDGGWSLYSLSPSYRRAKIILKYWSDGYATGYVTFVLQRAGVPRTNPRLARGLAWLRRHQRLPQGRWVTSSINAWKSSLNPESEFMSDAATAFAVLSLTQTGPSAQLSTRRTSLEARPSAGSSSSGSIHNSKPRTAREPLNRAEISSRRNNTGAATAAG